MKITIEAEPKEIAALLLEIERQSRRNRNIYIDLRKPTINNSDIDIEEIVKKLRSASVYYTT